MSNKQNDPPEGFKWIPADPVGAMYVADTGKTKDGQRVRLLATLYPCEPVLLFENEDTGVALELPLSQASQIITPDVNNAEGQGYHEPIDPATKS